MTDDGWISFNVVYGILHGLVMSSSFLRFYSFNLVYNIVLANAASSTVAKSHCFGHGRFVVSQVVPQAAINALGAETDQF